MTARPRTAFTMIELLIVLAIVGLLVSLSVPAIQHARESARRTQCASNMRQIGLALQSYHDAIHTLPPALLWNPPGEPLGAGVVPIGFIDRLAAGQDPSNDTIYANWLILLLPFLEEDATYGMFDPKVPIAHANNAAIRSTQMALFNCPSDASNTAANLFARGKVKGLSGNLYARGNYAINGGPADACKKGVEDCRDGFIAPGDFLTTNWQVYGPGIGGVNRGIRLREITDGLSHTVAVDEIRAGIHELDPRGVWALGQVGSSITARHGMTGDAGVPNSTASDADDIMGCSELTLAIGAGTLQTAGMPCFAPSKSGVLMSNNQAGARSMHPSGVHALMADSSVTFVTDDVEPSIWHAIHTRDSADSVGGM